MISTRAWQWTLPAYRYQWNFGLRLLGPRIRKINARAHFLFNFSQNRYAFVCVGKLRIRNILASFLVGAFAAQLLSLLACMLCGLTISVYVNPS